MVALANRKAAGFALLMAGRLMASEPAVSLVLGGSLSTPFGPPSVSSDYGARVNLALATSLPAGELSLPLEIGFGLRTASLGFSDWFGRDVFTDLQMPFIVHVRLPFWKRLELLALWTPGYTLKMVSSSSFGGGINATESLRTRFNMGLGSGMQVDLPWGFRLRGHWVYNLFSPYPASRLTWSDAAVEAALPLLWKKDPG